MRSKMVFLVIIVTVLGLSSWQVFGLLKPREFADPNVLAASTSKTLEERVASLENRVYVLEKSTGLIKPSSTGRARESYLNLSGGRVFGSEWVKLEGSDFTFDASLYGSKVEVSWQGWIENGRGSVRIYDSTNHRVVDYSELSVESGVRSSFYSKPMSIWRGQNQYYIQGKNPWGELVLSSPRLKIVSR